MCLILFAYNTHPSYRLIVAANRDEFYERPTAAADFWPTCPQALAGRDLREGGTWMGITKDGKFAAITNYRDPASHRSGVPSRGKLVSSYLCGDMSPGKYLDKLSRQMDKYNGFNLLIGDNNDLFFLSNRSGRQQLHAGIYGLSNHLLDTPWPKVRHGKKALSAAMNKKGASLEEALFAILADRKKAPERQLPATGIGLEWERLLSPIFIKSPTYGTRSSTILLIGRNRRIRLVEKVFDGKPEPWLTSRFSFIMNKRE